MAISIQAFFNESKAQGTTLAQGDISIVGFSSPSSPKTFSFVTWKKLEVGTIIRFTDNGFHSAASSTSPNNFRGGEQTASWKATSVVDSGTVVMINTGGNNTASTGQVWHKLASGSATNSLALGTSTGDQIFAFQSDTLPPGGTTSTFVGTILFGIAYQGSSGPLTNWISSGTLTDGSQSYVPSDLLAANTLFFASNTNAAQFNGARTGLATSSAYKQLISNPANWSLTIGSIVLNSEGFSLTPPGIAPTITSQPSSDIICAGGSTSFSVTANNANTYQWQVNTGSGFASISNGGVYSGAGSATLNITGTTAGMSGYTYRCVVTGSATPNATSNTASLTVNATASISSNPSTAIICAGGNTSFSVSASNATVYQWQVNTGAGFSAISNGGVYSGATSSTLSITGATAGMTNYQYRVVATGSCTPSATSTAASLTVNPAPAIITNPSVAIICESSQAQFEIGASNATGYQWQVDNGAGYTNISDGAGAGGVNYSGATTFKITITNVTLAMSGYRFRCVVIGSCTPNATSAGRLLTVNANVTYYEDWDGDGYGNPSVTTISCSGAPGGFVSNNDDCDDNNSSTYPGASEICGDGMDNNCDGNVDENCGTQLKAAMCGTTLAAIDTDILADTVVDATQYRFRIINGANVQTIDIGTPSFNMTQLASFDYLTTYTIDVMVELNGSWTAYGSACNITTPAEPCGIWKGTVSTEWSNTGNWSCGLLPTITSNTTISAAAPYMPTVNITDAVCNDLTIEAGASVTITEGNNLTIAGSVTNNGSFTAVGKATFSGNNQTIPGGSFEDLEIAGTGTQTLSGTATVSGVFSITSSSLQLGNYNLIIGGSGSVTGGSAANYVVINGTGKLIQENIGTGGRTGAINFPIGTPTSYNPLVVSNAGTADGFAASVISNIYDTYDGSDVPTGTAQATDNVNRTWFVTETVPGGSNATLTFQWNASDELSGFDRSAAFPSHYANGYWNPGATTAASGSNPYTISMSGITSFSPFGIGSTNSVLPLTLVSFTGKTVTNGVGLQWNTSNEVNTASFDVERATSGGSFVKVGTVPAGTVGAYSYTDKTTTAGATASYRLKMIDKDGKFTYSYAITVKYTTKESNSYSVYPNPVTGSHVYVKAIAANNANVKIDVIDITGRTWSTHSFTQTSNGRLEIPVQQLPSGSYILRITDKSGEQLQVTKFTVTH